MEEAQSTTVKSPLSGGLDLVSKSVQGAVRSPRDREPRAAWHVQLPRDLQAAACGGRIGVPLDAVEEEAEVPEAPAAAPAEVLVRRIRAPVDAL